MVSTSIETDEGGAAVTTFTTEAVDQAALIRLINRLDSLGLPVLSVEVLPEESACQAAGGQDGSYQAVDAAGGK